MLLLISCVRTLEDRQQSIRLGYTAQSHHCAMQYITNILYTIKYILIYDSYTIVEQSILCIKDILSITPTPQVGE